MRSTLFRFTLLFSFSVTATFAQNEFNSRLFYSKPTLFNSKSKITNLRLSKYDVSIALPLDKRNEFYGEEVYKNVRVHEMEEFFKSSTMIEIQTKMKADMKRFGAGLIRPTSKNRVFIQPTVEVFYPKISGFIHGKSLAKVRLTIDVTQNDSLMINSTYESFYITDGTDNSFEGSIDMTIEDGANVTLGMALREALDQFYSDLKEALSSGNGKLVVTGKVTHSKTGEGLSATVLFKSDSSYSTSTAADGKFKLTLPFSRHYNIQVSADDFVALSEQFNINNSLRRTQKKFSLQPMEVGKVVNLKNVLFYMGTTELLEDSYHELDDVVAFLKRNARVNIELNGHTDNQGDAHKDLVLSQQRVDKIKSYLVSKGISAHRILGKGFGGTKPIASNENEEGRRLNRRVEFVITANQ